MVERAQQKLKLDAMVVQSGRLADASSKLSKEEMLAAVKFGADHVFRSTESRCGDDEGARGGGIWRGRARELAK